MLNTANKLTIFRIIVVPFFIYFIYQPTLTSRYIAFAIFVVASLTDFLDGYIARHYNQITNLGKLLDPVADKILVVAALVALVDLGDIAGWVVIVIISRDFFIDVLRMNAAAQGVVVAAGSLGKFKTVLQMLAIAVILLNNYPAVLYRIPLDKILLYSALFMTVLSGIDYTAKNWQKLKL